MYITYSISDVLTLAIGLLPAIFYKKSSFVKNLLLSY